jgi:hypothetical protein
MERNRDNEVRSVTGHYSAQAFHCQQRQRIAQVYALTVLEGMYHVTNGPFIEEACTGSIKMRLSCQACAAAVIAPGTAERNSAHWTERRREQRHLLAAGRADMERAGIRDKRTADVADRWQDDVKQSGEELLDR